MGKGSALGEEGIKACWIVVQDTVNVRRKATKDKIRIVFFISLFPHIDFPALLNDVESVWHHPQLTETNGKPRNRGRAADSRRLCAALLPGDVRNFI